MARRQKAAARWIEWIVIGVALVVLTVYLWDIWEWMLASLGWR
jgi:hypothetical protein